MSKFLPDDPREFAKFLRERAEGHAPEYDLAVYGRPQQWHALAELIESHCQRASWCAPVDDQPRPVQSAILTELDIARLCGGKN